MLHNYLSTCGTLLGYTHWVTSVYENKGILAGLCLIKMHLVKAKFNSALTESISNCFYFIISKVIKYHAI